MQKITEDEWKFFDALDDIRRRMGEARTQAYHDYPEEMETLMSDCRKWQNIAATEGAKTLAGYMQEWEKDIPLKNSLQMALLMLVDDMGSTSMAMEYLENDFYSSGVCGKDILHAYWHMLLVNDCGVGDDVSDWLEESYGEETGEAALYRRLSRIRMKLLSSSRQSMEKHRFEVFAAMGRILQLLAWAEEKGVDGILQQEEELKECQDEAVDFFVRGLELLRGKDKKWLALLTGEMERYVEDKQEKALLYYLYLRAVILIAQDTKGWIKREVLFSILPPEERSLYKKWKMQGRRRI